MIEPVPPIGPKDLVRILLDNDRYIDLKPLVDKANQNYEYWDKVKYRKPLPEGFTSLDLWKCIKFERLKNKIIVWKKYNISLSITSSMQQFCHEFDMNYGENLLVKNNLNSNQQKQYLISSLIEEAIFSSQIEGASTTRKVAKDMLQKKLSPKDKSQLMIYNNYQTINFLVENKDKELTPDLLLEVHRLITNKTLENPADEGRFRQDDNIVVGNEFTGETVHYPPSFSEIPEFVCDLCVFFNQEKSEPFIHPIIRGIIVHFLIAYMHPFADGNGRTARALFYWYMLRQGYWLTEYLSISRVIAKSKAAYEKSYLYVEADSKDLGYFVQYNLIVLSKAFENLKNYIKRKNDEKNDVRKFLQLGNINERQAEIIKLFVDNPNNSLTVKDLQIRFYVSATTAKTDIIELVNREILKEIFLNKVKRAYIKGERFDQILSNL